jgi:cytochrome c-type biogenesis protein CcmH
MRSLSRPLAFLLVVSGVAFLSIPAAAQGGGPTDDEVNAIASQLYCPVCENVPLDVCPTQACAQWRAIIRQMLAEGRTEREIKDYFVVQYGERVLAAPPPRGFNWLAYIVPAAAFAIAVVMLAMTLRRWMRPAQAEVALEIPPVDDPYIERVEQELRRRA